MTNRVYIWDIFIRLFHWSLTLFITIALLTGFFGGLDILWLHVLVGVIALTLISLRLIWGVYGRGYARIQSFLFSKQETLAHIMTLRNKNAHHHLGHNPLGALMVFALGGAIVLIVLSGVASG